MRPANWWGTPTARVIRGVHDRDLCPPSNDDEHPCDHAEIISTFGPGNPVPQHRAAFEEAARAGV